MVYWYAKVVWGQFDLLSLGMMYCRWAALNVSPKPLWTVPPTSLSLPTRQVLYGRIVRLVFVGQSEDSCPFSRLNKDTLCIMAGAVAEVSLCMEEQAVR